MLRHIKEIKNRRGTLSVCEIIDTFASYSVGVEIGVANGDTAKSILRHCNISHLFLVDPYVSGYSNHNDRNDISQRMMDNRYKYVKSLFSSNYPSNSTLMRCTSEEASKSVPDDIDFVYIDGDHSYESVCRDLECWVPKVRDGGLVMGDDWGGGFDSVVSSVVDFCKKNDPFISPFNNYDNFSFSCSHCGAPTNDPVVNKRGCTWWALKKRIGVNCGRSYL